MRYTFILWIAAFFVEQGFGEAAEPPDQITNSIGIKLTLIPAGKFTMGDANLSSEQKPHCVTLTNPFYLGVYEVSNAQWHAVMGSVPSRWKDEDRPVESITWATAIEFCRKLSEVPEEKTTGRVYRLPTEAEWERACRAGTTTAYSFGDDKDGLDDHGWFDGNSGSRTHSVGQKKPNPWGLYDMHGNVWEWCSDWYGEYAADAVTNPQGPSEGSLRVFRGGSWIYPAGSCRSARRRRYDPSYYHSGLGFRLALSLPEPKPPNGDE